MNIMPLFPSLMPRVTETAWFSVDTPKNDSAELDAMELDHTNWMTAVGQREFEAAPVGRLQSDIRQLDDGDVDEDADEIDNVEDDDLDDDSHDDEDEEEDDDDEDDDDDDIEGQILVGQDPLAINSVNRVGLNSR